MYIYIYIDWTPCFWPSRPGKNRRVRASFRVTLNERDTSSIENWIIVIAGDASNRDRGTKRVNPKNRLYEFAKQFRFDVESKVKKDEMEETF